MLSATKQTLSLPPSPTAASPADRRPTRTVLAAWLGSWTKAGLLVALWAGCDWIARHFALPLPGGVLGLFLLLAALATGLVRSDWLRPGVGRLMGHMLLFFIPAMMAPLAHHELFGLVGLKIMAIIVISTATVMLSTGLIVEACFRRRPAVAGASASSRP